MKILITGIQGYVGTNLVSAFKAENIIFGLDIISTQMDGVQKVFGTHELKDIPNVDVVIHLAGKSNEAKDFSEALAYFQSNTLLTQNIFNWFAQSTAKTFIFFSSVKAVTNEVKTLPLTEDMEPNPFGVLGESKLMAERYILSQYLVDKKVFVLRPSIIIGNGGLGNRNLRWMYQCAKNGFPFPFGKFECSRSFTTIDNLTYVLKKMSVTDMPSDIYNVADDGFLTLNEVYEIMCSVLQKKVRIWRLNKGFVKFVSRIGTEFHFSFDDYKYKRLTSNFKVSNEKIKKVLGIQKMPVSTVIGMEKAIRDFKLN